MIQLSGPPLTQAEIDALPNGATVLVIWAGGNGPHRYVFHDGAAWLTSNRDIHVADLKDCGAAPRTQVWLSPEK